jgi:plasmid replication initiation protein
LYGWTKKHVAAGTKQISLKQLRTVLGLDSMEDAEGKIIKEAPLQIWANLHRRALAPAIAQINKKMDLRITLESLKRSKHRWVGALVFSITTQAPQTSDSKRKGAK